MERFTTEDGLPRNRIVDLAEDADGNLWIATWRGGLTRFDGRQFTTYRTDDGLPSLDLRDLFYGLGSLWISTGWRWYWESGLTRFDGETFDHGGGSLPGGDDPRSFPT